MKRALKESFRNIPEGEQVVRIADIDESKYAKFQKLTVTIEDVSGATARVNFDFMKDDDTPNDVAEGIYTRMCRAALNDQTLDECDTRDLIGAFVRVEMIHKEGDRGGIFSNVKKWIGPADGFERPAGGRPKASTESKSGTMSAMERLAAMKAAKK